MNIPQLSQSNVAPVPAFWERVAGIKFEMSDDVTNLGCLTQRSEFGYFIYYVMFKFSSFLFSLGCCFSSASYIPLCNHPLCFSLPRHVKSDCLNLSLQ